MIHRFLVVTCFASAIAVPALAQSNSANEGAAAPDGTQSAPQAMPMTPAPARDQRQAQRRANSDPYNMPQNRAAAAHRDEATGNSRTPADADGSATGSSSPSR
jgi:hypothetical protein